MNDRFNITLINEDRTNFIISSEAKDYVEKAFNDYKKTFDDFKMNTGVSVNNLYSLMAYYNNTEEFMSAVEYFNENSGISETLDNTLKTFYEQNKELLSTNTEEFVNQANAIIDDWIADATTPHPNYMAGLSPL